MTTCKMFVGVCYGAINGGGPCASLFKHDWRSSLMCQHDGASGIFSCFRVQTTTYLHLLHRRVQHVFTNEFGKSHLCFVSRQHTSCGIVYTSPPAAMFCSTCPQPVPPPHRQWWRAGRGQHLSPANI